MYSTKLYALSKHLQMNIHLIYKNIYLYKKLRISSGFGRVRLKYKKAKKADSHVKKKLLHLTESVL